MRSFGDSEAQAREALDVLLSSKHTSLRGTGPNRFLGTLWAEPRRSSLETASGIQILS